jgi:predicted enzyme related to lactoylglutathione lyase
MILDALRLHNDPQSISLLDARISSLYGFSMANIDKHAPGTFCWIELATTDQAAAKGFYNSLFGWSPNDSPMGPEQVYTIFQLEGRAAAAAFTLRPEELSKGIPPYWGIYIAVDSADDTARRAGELGGKVVEGPFDVMEAGRMAVIQDPTGAIFSIWQPKANAGTGVTGVDGTLCWADLSTPNTASASEFYSKLFGWQIAAEEKDPSGYLHIKSGDQFIGGVPPASHRPPNAPPHWLPYFLVSDCDSAANRAKENGASFHLAPMTMEGVGRMAVIADPQRAVFALFQPSRHS